MSENNEGFNGQPPGPGQPGQPGQYGQPYLGQQYPPGGYGGFGEYGTYFPPPPSGFVPFSQQPDPSERRRLEEELDKRELAIRAQSDIKLQGGILSTMKIPHVSISKETTMKLDYPDLAAKFAQQQEAIKTLRKSPIATNRLAATPAADNSVHMRTTMPKLKKAIPGMATPTEAKVKPTPVQPVPVKTVPAKTTQKQPAQEQPVQEKPTESKPAKTQGPTSQWQQVGAKPAPHTQTNAQRGGLVDQRGRGRGQGLGDDGRGRGRGYRPIDDPDIFENFSRWETGFVYLTQVIRKDGSLVRRMPPHRYGGGGMVDLNLCERTFDPDAEPCPNEWWECPFRMWWFEDKEKIWVDPKFMHRVGVQNMFKGVFYPPDHPKSDYSTKGLPRRLKTGALVRGSPIVLAHLPEMAPWQHVAKTEADAKKLENIQQQ